VAPWEAQRPASLRSALDLVVRDVPDALLDSRGRADLLAAADALPQVLARRSLGLELRLQGRARGDLFVGAVPTAPDGQILQRRLLEAGFDDQRALMRLVKALARWQHNEGWLARACTFVLLELDASRRDADADADAVPPLPSVYLAPRGADNDNAGSDRRNNSFHRDPTGLIAALSELTGCRPDPAATAELRRLLNVLPPHAEIFAAGAMLSRPSAAAPRIAVRRLRAQELARVLGGLGRQRAAQALVPLATRLQPHLTNMCLALDLGPHASDAVGIELYTGSYWAAGEVSGWEGLLRALVDSGLADADRATAAAALPHAATADAPSVGLSHVKLTAICDRLAPSKLYVGYEGAHKLRAAHGESA
jgi:hypothetical protein